MALPVFVGLVYGMFFLSGAAALVYQVVWVRSLTLVFGGTHLAVTAVLSIFMGGLALGGYAIGSYADRAEKPLRLYGLLELGIAASALAFAALTRSYPSIYVALAQGRDDATLYLSVVRMLFSVVALIVPTTLMGGTLPVLSRFVSRQPADLRRHLSFLYAVNTLGAVFGALLAGFYFLPTYAVSTTLYVAVATNAVIGFVCLALRDRTAESSPARGDTPSLASPAPPGPDAPAAAAAAGRQGDSLPMALVLWGIGLSGFCALGYEVLWTRVLTIAIGASVYGFTIILVAFLTGIALGSEAYGVFVRVFRRTDPGTRRVIAWFGLAQVAIGIAALVVTINLRDIPAQSVRLQNYFLGSELPSFQARAWANFVLAFLYMVVPACFMGAAFPLAGEALARHRQAVGRAVGEVLSYNTVGAILGAAVSGLFAIQVFGIERSLQLLAVLNTGLGLTVLGSLHRRRWPTAATATAALAVLAFLVLDRDAARMWDTKYFAIFRSNQPAAFSTPELVREAAENTDVLYYAEGIESTVSVIRIRGGEPSFVTNGRVEASSTPQEQQCQFTLGHLPMLLNRDPKEVLVVGLGSGMTAGATAVHPGVNRVTIVEIEPKVLGVARTFQDHNHHVLDNPKVGIVFNDGRNFLMTTSRTFDVITADPIHPWFRGSGYLYASEYFQLVAAHLRPGGVVAQWLPIYELTPQDLRSVVKTFQQHFAYTLLWLTHYDAEIVGSNSPFVIDEAELEARLAEPAIAGDLQRVSMGSATDFLSYFVMGTDGMRRFGQGGTLNTDDRLYLEFSAPFSIANPAVMGQNVLALAALRESLLPYLKPAPDPLSQGEQRERWRAQLAAARIADPARALFLAGRQGNPEFARLLEQLRREYHWYAPGQFLSGEYQAAMALAPRLIQQSSFSVTSETGATAVVDVSAVLVPISATRASIMFVDNRAKLVYGELYVDHYDRSEFVGRFVGDVMDAVRAAYRTETSAASERRVALPSAEDTRRRMRAVISSRVQGAKHES